MRHSISCTGVVVAILLSLAAAKPRSGPSAVAEAAKPDGPSAPAGAEKLDLATVHATFRQPGLQPMSAAFTGEGDNRRFEKPYGYHLECIHKEYRGGASNVFLVAGSDITAVVAAARFVLTGGRPVDRLSLPAGERLWMVAYLGISGSTPPAWQIDSAAVSPAGRVGLRTTRGQAETRDMAQYLAFIPLPAARAGAYAVELQDARTGQTTLQRRVEVAAANAPPAAPEAVPPAKIQGPAPLPTPQQQKALEELKRQLEKEAEKQRALRP